MTEHEDKNPQPQQDEQPEQSAEQNEAEEVKEENAQPQEQAQETEAADAPAEEAAEVATAVAEEETKPKEPDYDDEEYWALQDEGVEYSKEEYDQMMAMYESTLTSIEEGELIKGKVLRINESNVVLDIGFKSEGSVSKEEFKSTEEINVGDEVEVYLESLEDEDGVVVLSKKKADFLRVWDHNPQGP